VNTAQWRVRVSYTEMRRRTGGRNRLNALKILLKTLRRQEVLRLLEAWGFGYGVQARIARVLHVDPSVVSRDVKAMFPVLDVCETCGHQQPRAWWDT
jgi:hypothetical protein